MRKHLSGLAVLLTGISLLSTVEAAGPRVDQGSMVHLSYFMEANGVPIVSEKKRRAIQLVIGKGSYPKDFEKQLIGLKKGDAREITLTPEQAYGPHLTQLVKRVSRKKLPPTIPLREGMLLGSKEGKHAIRIAKILDDSVVMDENHPLAGKTLKYHVQVTDVG